MNVQRDFPYLSWMREQGVEETLANYLEIAGIQQATVDNWTAADDAEYGVLIPPHLTDQTTKASDTPQSNP